MVGNPQITKHEYETWAKLNEKFEMWLCQCAIEVLEITNNRKPYGDYFDDFELNNDGTGYDVWFQESADSDAGYDTIAVPIKYIYDKKYRKNYKTMLEEERWTAAITRAENDRAAMIHADEMKEERERTEYERLRQKFENDIK